nr:STAS/SEC14 domain-containing protein [uncultured Holophaga sp.]
MATITVVDSPSITLWYHSDTRIIHHQIHKYTFGEVLRDALNKGVALMSQHHAVKWLSDDRNNGPLPPEDMEWNRTVWVPQVVKAGWKYWALVVPEKAVAQMNMKRFQAEFAAAGVTVQTFTDPDAAMKWLEAQG